MLRIAPIALMASMAFGTAFITGCDEGKDSKTTSTETKQPDGSMSKTETSSKTDANGTTVKKEESKTVEKNP